MYCKADAASEAARSTSVHRSCDFPALASMCQNQACQNRVSSMPASAQLLGTPDNS
ncbi:MAG: hypothetical protein QOI90_3815 [Mycobacterium sp.]|nr:hypothetical protein [Mycobacterium sp.]